MLFSIGWLASAIYAEGKSLLPPRTRTATAVAAVALATAVTAAAVGFVGSGTSGAARSDPVGCAATTATDIPQPSQAQLGAGGLGDLPLAPASTRRDLTTAPFHDPTAVSNPLFPIADLDSAILNGRVDGKTFHTETTLLPFTQLVEWTPGQCVRVLVSQYTAFLDGRLQETAIDLYAQDDAGSVWYLGESVFDYRRNGMVSTTEGTWHAGVEGPIAMIMPAEPRVGDVHRPENIPGNVFEEVKVTAVNRTFNGPSGPVTGGLIAQETHQDGTLSDKLFAPGYGEFRSTDGPDVEAMALASPTDWSTGGVPATLRTISRNADAVVAMPLRTLREWSEARRAAARMESAWAAFLLGDVPPRLVKPMRVALRDLAHELEGRDRLAVRLAALAVAYAGNDFQLRYRQPVEIDTVRFQLWSRRTVLDALDGSLGGVRSDVVTLEWIRDRIAHTLDAVTLSRVDFLISGLGTAVEDGDIAAATELARTLQSVTGRLG